MKTTLSELIYIFVGGTLAVFIATFLTLSFGSASYKLVLSLIIAAVEGFTLKFDNLFITTTVLAGYYLQVSS